MKLAARIFTALAIAFAMAYIAGRDHSPDASAATGVIDALNVGTCFATNTDVFDEGDCDDNNDANEDRGQYNLSPEVNAAGGPSGLRDLKQTASLYATYAVDPKTSAEEPRAILIDSDLVKISISDAGRDRRTPFLLRAGGDNGMQRISAGTGSDPQIDCYNDQGDIRPGLATPQERELCAVYELVNDEFNADADPEDLWDGERLLDRSLGQAFVNTVAGTETENVQFTGSGSTGSIVEVEIPAANTGEDFRPLHRKFRADDPDVLTDDTIIRIYGYRIGGPANRHGCDSVIESDIDSAPDPDAICDLGAFVVFDEDIGTGASFLDFEDPSYHVAPFVSIQRSLSTAESIRIRYIYYETSEKEDIVGGATGTEDRSGYAGTLGTDPDVDAPQFVEDEEGLELEVTGDGVDRTQNLWLTETDRFSGRYEGFLRLTDPNGDCNDRCSQAERDNRTADLNWGYRTADATGPAESGAAILGVQSGPVTIRYRDSDGDLQTLQVSIDTRPPDIQIDSPAYEENLERDRVRVAGSFNDSDSGLREDSFRMYFDNRDDEDENGTSGEAVLDLAVWYQSGLDRDMNTGNPLVPRRYYRGLVLPRVGDTQVGNADLTVELRQDYVGYLRSPVFGVLLPELIYLDHEDDANLENADPENFDNGDEQATFDDNVRLDIQNMDDDAELNNTIDFQGLAMDIAGNIGFSDSDPAGPSFIHDFGTEPADRAGRCCASPGRYNVLGWYARHIISIDQEAPRLYNAVTGFYDEDDDEEPVPSRRGVMLIFDGAIDPDSVDSRTFRVELDADSSDARDATVSDTTVVGDRVYILLSEDLAADSSPVISINIGRTISDPAGNSLTSADPLDGDADDGEAEIESQDGIPPTFEVTLRNGSGAGVGDEGPSSLTMDSIVVSITSDEDINGSPRVVFVCDGFTWSVVVGTTTTDFDVDDVIENRSGRLTPSAGTMPAPQPDVKGTCGDDDGTMNSLDDTVAHSRPGNTWEYEWRRGTSAGGVPDGGVTVVAFGRDVSVWQDGRPDDTGAPDYHNYGAATGVFRLDSRLRAPTEEGFGSVQPGENSEVFESRPFVLLEFEDASTVSIEEFKIDGETVEIQALGNNRFLYWPQNLDFGKHKVEVDAIDIAQNERTFSYEFEVKQRTAFTVELLAGWNAVSVPAMPVNPAIESVFTIDEVDQVISWDSSTPDAPWRIATKVEGVWTTNEEFSPLTTIESGRGYWVHANGFVDQSVLLAGAPDRESNANAPAGPRGILTIAGWNFVGVVDNDGDQTQEGDFGDELMDSTDATVTAGDYLRDFRRAYIWDPIKSQFQVIEDDDNVKIGDGIWVFYVDNFNIAP